MIPVSSHITFLQDTRSPNSEECRMWQAMVDPEITWTSGHPVISTLSCEERLRAIKCFMKLKGRTDPSSLGGETSAVVSTVLPIPSVEIAALYYIRYLYFNEWNHAYGAALVDKDDQYDTRLAVAQAFESYEKWLRIVEKIGINEALRRKLDPMDYCPKVHWYETDPLR